MMALHAGDLAMTCPAAFLAVGHFPVNHDGPGPAPVSNRQDGHENETTGDQDRAKHG